MRYELERECGARAQLRSSLANQAQAQLSLTQEKTELKVTIGDLRRRLDESYAKVDEIQLVLEEKDRVVVKTRKEVFESEAIRRKLHNTMLELKGNIRVFARVRPVLPSDLPSTVTLRNRPGPTARIEELEEKVKARFAFPDQEEYKDSESAMGKEGKEVYTFGFDRVFEPHSTQLEVFEEISPLAQSCVDGYNVCIFAYGQTGSGKSWTMEGGPTEDTAGMIPRAVEQVFRVAEEMRSKGWEYRIEGQFREIYNETIHDLLTPFDASDKKKHEIKHDPKTGRTTVTDLTVVPLTSPEQVKGLLARAQRRRSVAATLMNERSSRSHSVFTLRISGVHVGSRAMSSLSSSAGVNFAEGRGDFVQDGPQSITAPSALERELDFVATKSMVLRSAHSYRSVNLTTLVIPEGEQQVRCTFLALALSHGAIDLLNPRVASGPLARHENLSISISLSISLVRFLPPPLILPSSTTVMQGVRLLVCAIPSNPDIAGIGVRIAIYIQNLLCFIPALWALWDGKVTDYELDSTDGYSTTNLFLAFAILISCIVQALTIGVANYHASIVLSLSWMNNTSVFVYFLLYVQYRGQEDIEPKWSAWVNHIKRRVHGMVRLPDGLRQRGGSHRLSAKDAYKVLIQRITLVLGSLHLSLMAALGIWLWSKPQSFGKDEGSRCAFDVAELAILGIFVPFGKEGLRAFSLALYSLFLIPGFNLLLPVGAFLSIYCLASRRRPSPSDLPTSRAPPTLPSTNEHIELRPLPNRSSPSTANHPSTANLLNSAELNGPEMQTQTLDPQPQGRIAKLQQVMPVGIGLLILLCINIIFIVDIELTLRRNRHYQDDASSDEAEWGFGQILAMVLVFMPLRDLGESIVRRRHELQTKLNESLTRAINSKDVEQISRWVNAGADINVEGDDGQKAFNVACSQEGQHQLVSLLIEKDVDQAELLAEAIRVKNPEYVSLCVRAGADVNVRTPEDQTALDVAFAQEDQHELISLLVEKGVVLNEVLAEAIPNKNFEHLSGCVKYGADVNMKASDSRTALEVTVLEKKWDLVRSIVKAGASVNQQFHSDWLYEPALQVAYSQDAPMSVLELMLEKGADPNTRSGSFNEVCLHEACRKGKDDVVSLLLKYGANPDIQDFNQWTPLHYACASKHAKCTEILLEAGANINAQEDDGWTALHLACWNRHVDCVKLLLERGADTSIRDKDGRTAFQDASRRGYTEVVELLRSINSEHRSQLIYHPFKKPYPGRSMLTDVPRDTDAPMHDKSTLIDSYRVHCGQDPYVDYRTMISMNKLDRKSPWNRFKREMGRRVRGIVHHTDERIAGRSYRAPTSRTTSSRPYPAFIVPLVFRLVQRLAVPSRVPNVRVGAIALRTTQTGLGGICTGIGRDGVSSSSEELACGALEVGLEARVPDA
ncbi:hypothetical protein NMY22_g14979 [Coprinellus aureogranulatus]|nr:hypothetical protein NMY22_g14979 [Coprinellus aureogranulatus]